MTWQKKFYPEIGISGFSSVDGTISFYLFVNSLLQPKMTVLDFGAGRGVAHLDDDCATRRSMTTLKGRCAKVIGADVDPVVMTNPALDEAVMIQSDGRMALPDCSIDLVVADWVFEHIPEPEAAARELERVVKPGGWICARTPNRNGYIALGNRLLPARLKDRILSRAQPGRKEDDVFPALYFLNSRAALKAHFPEDRFRHCVFGWNSEPSYFSQNFLMFYLFALWHGLTARISPLHWHIFIQKRD